MIKREVKLVITFQTTSDAMAMEQMCKDRSADGRLIPVPRAISAGCGLAWCAKLASRDALTALMAENGVTAEGIYECLV